MHSDGSVYDQAGKKIGTIRSTKFATGTDAPRWVAFTIGPLGHGPTFAPLDQLTAEGDDIHLPYSKEIIKDASHSDDGALSGTVITALIDHYDLEPDGTEPALFD
ncbi:hypothetical protein AEQ27_09375 [Frigoribacterium sp. RIT-PI-h]|nr:hypothetical protein AEQ27_09375 [Frigoribacterium sp. RIT-PI-h]